MYSMIYKMIVKYVYLIEKTHQTSCFSIYHIISYCSYDDRVACINTADIECSITDIFVLQVVMTYITEVSLTNEAPKTHLTLYFT